MASIYNSYLVKKITTKTNSSQGINLEKVQILCDRDLCYNSLQI